MAGTSIEASLDLGFVWAKLSFGADGIIYFDPFWFEVSAYCRISAGINLDLGLFTISFSITLGATIKVWGRTSPVGRSSRSARARFPWSSVVHARSRAGRCPGASSSASTSRTPSGGPEPCRASRAGARSHGDWGQHWSPLGRRDGGPALPGLCRVRAHLCDDDSHPDAGHRHFTAAGSPCHPARRHELTPGALPMNVRQLASTLTISLELINPVTGAASTTAADGRPLAEKLARLAERWGQAGAAGASTDAFPIGVWGEPQPANLPAKPSPPVTSSALAMGCVWWPGSRCPRWGLTSTTTRSRPIGGRCPARHWHRSLRVPYRQCRPPRHRSSHRSCCLGVGRRPSLRRPWRGSAGAPARWAQCARGRLLRRRALGASALRHPDRRAGQEERCERSTAGTGVAGGADRTHPRGARSSRGISPAVPARPSVREPPRSPMDASSVVPHRRWSRFRVGWVGGCPCRWPGQRLPEQSRPAP